MNTFHEPVLVKEVLEGLHIAPGKKYIDATVGGGGHGIEILRRGGVLLGIDVDREAIEQTKKIFNLQFSIYKEGKDWKLVQGNFRDIEKIAKENGFAGVSGVLFDLGVSSHQLDTAARGFSYRFLDGPLDLRLNQSQKETAAALVNRLSQQELEEIFARFGEEEKAHEIAGALVKSRRVKPIQTVGDMVRVVESVVPDNRNRNAVLSRIFQAIRIALNDEMAALEEGLLGAGAVLARGGRLAVISFHSLEDRMVKRFFQKKGWRKITKRPLIAGRAETMQNPRSRSAKLRIAEKL